jgi:hypothetical protein
MNPYWVDHQVLKRDSGSFSDSAMTAIVFKTKFSALMKFIQQRRILGKVSAFVWGIEYQKRGLAHAHILFWSDFDTQDVHAEKPLSMSDIQKILLFLTTRVS